MTSKIHINTYTAGEDNGRLAELAKELGLQKQRQVRKQVRSNDKSFSFSRRNDDSISDLFATPLTPLTASRSVSASDLFAFAATAALVQQEKDNNDGFNTEATTDEFSAQEMATPNSEDVKSSLSSATTTNNATTTAATTDDNKMMSLTLTQRKTLQARRGREKVGTCQVALNLPSTILSPGDNLPLDMEIAHSCYQKYCLEEIRIRIHEVQTTTIINKNRRKKTKTRDVKLTKYDILTNGADGRKSEAIDIKGLNVAIPETAECDSFNDVSKVQVHHYIEIKLLSSGREETVRFKFPLAIGGDQFTCVPNVHHSSFLSVVRSSSSPKTTAATTTQQQTNDVDIAR